MIDPAARADGAERSSPWKPTGALLLAAALLGASCTSEPGGDGAAVPRSGVPVPSGAERPPSVTAGVDSDVDRARREILGRWVRETDESPVYVPTPRAKEIVFLSDGTFQARYDGEELEMLRRYLDDPTLGPEVQGRYRIFGRSGHDLYLTPLNIEMSYGPRQRRFTLEGNRLMLGNVGDSWQEARYVRSGQGGP